MSIVGYTTLRLTRVFPSFGALCFDLAGGFFDGDFFRAAHRAWSEPLSCSIHSASSFLLSSPPKPSEAEPYPVPRSLLVPRLSSKRGVGLSYAVHTGHNGLNCNAGKYAVDTLALKIFILLLIYQAAPTLV